jgi:hypothetical protein
MKLYFGIKHYYKFFYLITVHYLKYLLNNISSVYGD